MVIDAIRPAIDGGRYPVKRVVGDRLVIEADLLVDGHVRIAARLRYRRRGESAWREVAMAAVTAVGGDPGQPDDDVWRAAFPLEALGTWEYTVCAWVDAWASWTWALGRKLAAGQDVALELRHGAALVDAALVRLKGDAAGASRRPGDSRGSDGSDDRTALKALARALEQPGDPAARARIALGAEADALMRAHPDRAAETTREPPLAVTVDPPRARFSSWYELFPRSTGASGHHDTLRDAEQRLAYIADMGFDVVYLPPIHPIGRTHRKGRDNSLTATPDDPGSPWAIGAAEGGHRALHPALGTLDDFHHFLRAAGDHGLQVALDIAFQTSPDHPYVTEHPEWFAHRADGTIQYAENPPKQYQDIYPFDFGGDAWESLWHELRGVILFWIAQGVSIFRIDNPHTKPLPFWQWCIGTIKQRHPETIFLAEAFTRPKIMYGLAKAGFSQSYTYFTWRTTKDELTHYVKSIVDTEVAQYFRPNFWPNTPDILPEHLQVGTRATFVARAVLASTLSPSWGIYGPAFELQERTARDGAEEYAGNEKYQLRQWDLDRSDSLRPILKRLNQIRRDNPELQRLQGTVFHQTDNPFLICYSRALENQPESQPGSDAGPRAAGADAGEPRAPARTAILVVVNLDPHNRQSGWLSLPLEALGLTGDRPFPFQAHDLIADTRYLWQGGEPGTGARAFVTLDPQVMPAHVFRIRQRVRSERTFEYYL